MLANSWLALGITFTLAIAWLRLVDFIAHKGWISSSFSRKIIHLGTGPIFVLCWLLFPSDSYARYLAAIIPLLITLQFVLVGLGVIKDQAAVDAMSRTGDRKEILKGPLYYGIVFIFITIVFWKNSPVGISALMLLCGGDAMADIMGKKIVSNRIPWSPRKTLAGSIAMFATGWLLTVIVLLIYVSTGIFERPFVSLLFPLTMVTLGGTVIESLPFPDIDNITVPLAAVILGSILF